MKKNLLFVLLFCSLGAFAQKKQIELEDLWVKGTFRVKSVPGIQALSNGTSYTRIENEKGAVVVNVYDILTDSFQKQLIPALSFNKQALRYDDFQISKDGSKVLLYADAENIYRRSVLYHVYVYDFNTKQINQLFPHKVLHASISPNSKDVAFVYNNNLYVKYLETNVFKAVTEDGFKNEIINGNCDWVYEEEFEFTKAYEWSENGTYIAFYKFNEMEVPTYTIPLFDSTYPTLYSYKYPKAGYPNSKVSIHTYHLANKELVEYNINNNADHYFPRIKWMNSDTHLCVFEMNRHQNELKLWDINVLNQSADNFYTETSDTYVEVNDNYIFTKNGKWMLYTSEKDGYNHLYKFDRSKRISTAITKGSMDIETIHAFDEQRNVVYYTEATATVQRKLMAVNVLSNKATCLTPENGTHAIQWLEGNKYFVDKYSAINQVPVISLKTSAGKLIKVLESNKDLADKMQQYDLSNVALTTIPAEFSYMKVPLNAWLIKPSNFDSTKKYPVLLYQYSGPGSQEVADKFPIKDFFWYQMLAQKGYIIVCVDGVGTGFRGAKFKKATYLQLGKYESEDQLNVAKYFATLSYVDPNRIGIWGWSFGGFMSATCILKGNALFKTAVSVAPVTNWRYYDNIYTERYMRTPQENAAGYDDNAPDQMAHLLKGNLLLIHGTADDNVHVQNEMSLINNLIKYNKQFDSETYPNRNHGIYGGSTRYQLYKRITDYILKNL